jgi:pimeloyl-[acyl-carrier protein] methyl ester esterase
MPQFLIHGWATTCRIWPDWLLTSNTYPYHSSTFPDYSQLEREFLTFYQKQHKPLSIIGWSLGGMLALELAAAHSDKIEKILLISSTPRFTLKENYTSGLDPIIVKNLARKLARNKLQTQAHFYQLMFSASESFWAENFSKQIAPLLANITLTTLQTGLSYLYEKDLCHLLTSIHTPCHILHGTHDSICPPATGHYLANTIPHSTLDLIPGAGHIPFYTQEDYCKSYLQSIHFL